MKILTYSPSIEAYVEVSGKDGAKAYYDLSPDITSARVTRNSDTYSSFDITLQNKNRKYNGIFRSQSRKCCPDGNRQRSCHRPVH